MNVRPTWDETWMAVANTIKLRSKCIRDQVGAVIVNAGNRIVATGYNGPPAGMRFTNSDGEPENETRCGVWCPRSIATAAAMAPLMLSSDYSDCPSLHAEANALSVCDRSLREDGTIYITSGVCFSCAKLIANSGLHRAVIAPRTDDAHRNTQKSYDLLKQCGVTVVIS